MKKLLSVLLLVAMVATTLIPSSAKGNEVVELDGIQVEVNYVEPYLEEYTFYDTDGKHIVTMNRETFALTIDGEVIMPTITELPVSRTTVDYSTAVNVKYEIPWKGVASVVASLVSKAPGIKYDVASGIVNAVAAEGPTLISTYTQYRSVEQYYSSYHGAYYNKVISLNSCVYKNSISSSNLLYGPVDGDWFDPIRPY